MTNQNSAPAATPGQVFAQRVQETRERLKLSKQQLADRVEAIGFKPMHRMTVTKIEAGREAPWASTRAERVTLAEVLAFAAALNVSPVHLIAPLDDDQAVTVTPKLTTRAATLRGWIRGKHPLWTSDMASARSFLEWLTARPVSELIDWIASRRLRQLGRLERELLGVAAHGQATELVEQLLEPDEFKKALESAEYLDEVEQEASRGRGGRKGRHDG